MDKHGYQALYKRKTNEVGDEFLCIMKVGSEILHVISPLILFHICRFILVIFITFFCRDSFLHVKKMR